MTFPVNQKINPYQQQTAMGMNSDSTGNNTPMGLSSGDVQDNLINKSPTVKGVVDPGGKRRWLTWALFIPVWASMIYPMNKFNDACKGDFDKSLIGKVSRWAEARGNSKFCQSSVFKTIGEKWQFIKKGFMDKVVPKSRLLSAFIKTPTKAESHAVLMMAGGTLTELAADAAQKLEMLHKQTDKELQPELLKKMGVTVEEFERITEKSHECPDKIIEVCERLGKTDLDHYKHTKVGHIPFTKEKYCSDVIPVVGHKVLDVDVHFSAYANKMKAIRSANKTWLGKFVPKAMLRTIEGITNGTAGGKIAIGLAAFFIADSIKDAINAPKGEKGSTFAESNIHGLGFYILMPLMIGVMHRFGGLKYLGMDAEQLTKYREKIEVFNKKAQKLAEQGTKSAKMQWKVERNKLINELATMRKGLVPNKAKLEITGSKSTKFLKKMFYWPIKTFARAMTFGLETPQGFYKAKASFFEKLKMNPLISLKKAAGYPLRFGLVTVVISPFFINPILRLSHMIFGKPTKSVLDDGKEPEVKTQPQQPIIRPQQPNQTHPAQSVTMPAQRYSSNEPYQRQNLLDMYKAKHSVPTAPATPAAPAMIPVSQESAGMYAPVAAASSMMPNVYAENPQAQQMMPTYQEPARTYIPSSAPAMIPTSDEPVRTYMPSSAGVVVNPQVVMQENAKTNDAFLKAERAEQRAMGHFD